MTRIPEPLLSRYLEKLNDKLSKSATLNSDLRQLAAAVGSSAETTPGRTRQRISWCATAAYGIFYFEALGKPVTGFPPTYLGALDLPVARDRVTALLACLTLETVEEELLDAEQWRGIQQMSEERRASLRRMGACVQTILEEGDLDLCLIPMGGAVTGSAFFDFLVAAGRSSDDLVKYASLLSEVYLEQ